MNTGEIILILIIIVIVIVALCLVFAVLYYHYFLKAKVSAMWVVNYDLNDLKREDNNLKIVNIKYNENMNNIKNLIDYFTSIKYSNDFENLIKETIKNNKVVKVKTKYYPLGFAVSLLSLSMKKYKEMEIGVERYSVPFAINYDTSYAFYSNYCLYNNFLKKILGDYFNGLKNAVEDAKQSMINKYGRLNQINVTIMETFIDNISKFIDNLNSFGEKIKTELKGKMKVIDDERVSLYLLYNQYCTNNEFKVENPWGALGKIKITGI